MQFLSPLFWIAGLAIAVPIFLHLTRRQSKNSIPFSSLMFLSKIPLQERRRRRLKHLLLLALRCLGVILLVAAFARPVVKSQWLNQSNPVSSRSTVILIDRSMSMSRAGVWEGALEAARKRISEMRDTDEAVIVQFGENAEVLNPWLSGPARLSQVLQEQVTPSYEGTSYVEGLRIALEQLRLASHIRREIYLITDLQQSGMGESLGWRLPAGVTLEIENVGAQEANLYIESVRLERDVFEENYPNPVVVRLASSPRRAAQGEVQLYLADQLIDRRSFTLDENGVGTVTFKSFQVPEGVSRGRLVLEGEDSFGTDNAYYFVLERRPPRQIALLSGSSDSSSLYFEQAMRAGSNRPFTVVDIAASAIPELQPSTTPVLILNDVARPPDSEAVFAYLEEGGGLIIALANRVSPDPYNNRWSEIMPARLIERRYVRTGNQSFTSIVGGNWQHPIFSIFQPTGKNSLAEAQFYGYWQLEPDTESEILARFTQGSPLLVEKPVHQGKVLLFASSLDRVWNDFPLRSGFVPFWYQAVKYISQWENRPSFYQVSQAVSVRSLVTDDTQPGKETWNVLDPQGRRTVGLEEKRPDFLRLSLPGFYEIRANKKTDWIAANPSPQESDFKTVALEELQAAFGPAGRSAATQESAAQAPGGEEIQEQPMWWLMLLLAVSVLTVEAILANRAASSVRPAATTGGGH